MVHPRAPLREDASDEDIIARALWIAAEMGMQPGQDVLVPLQGPLRFDDDLPTRFPPYAMAKVRLGDPERGEHCTVQRLPGGPSGEAGPMPIVPLKTTD
jgi:hypothetical protein